MKKKYKITLAVLLVLLAVGVVAGPVIAALTWEHRWDANTIAIDKGYFALDFITYSFDTDDWQWPDATHVWSVSLDCYYPEHQDERVYVELSGGGVTVIGGCLNMTPTPAPTMDPYTP